MAKSLANMRSVVPNAPVVLLTDFGDQDWYVGVLKGVIACIAPNRPVIDLCHQVAPGDIVGAALILEAATPYFPPTSVFCCVVDPGVGTERRVLVADVPYKSIANDVPDSVALAQRQRFVGPDNGLIASQSMPAGTRYFAFDRKAHSELISPRISTTFHGRDIFAPLAAHLSLGFPPEQLGPEIFDPVTLDAAPIRKINGGVVGQVQRIDRFGNLITNLDFAELRREYPEHPPANWSLQVESITVQGISESYGEHAPGACLVYVGSMGYLEIAINLGHAARQITCEAGARVQLLFGAG